VRFKRKHVRRGHAPRGDGEVVEVRDREVVVRRELTKWERSSGRDNKGRPRQRTTKPGWLALIQTAEERVAESLMS
jgi:RNA 3'-terminal phosphate cyclase